MSDDLGWQQTKLKRIFAASILADWSNKLIMHPIDTVKVRLQFQKVNTHHHEIFNIVTIMRNAGPKALYRGLPVALIGAVPTALVYMPSYEIFKALIAQQAVQGSYSLPVAQLAGVGTGMVTACIRVPVLVVKSRLQLGLYSHPLAAVTALVRTDGILGFYAGLRATMLLDISFAVIQFTLLEQLRCIAYHLSGSTTLSTTQNAAVGFATGGLTALATAPIDVIKTRLQAQTAAQGCEQAAVRYGYRGLLHGLRAATSQDGILSLWRGMLPRLIQKSFGGSIWYSSYMQARRLLG